MKQEKRITLLVGSEFSAALALHGQLEQCGFQCLFVSTLGAVTDYLCRSSVDLVLSGLHLPDGTGFQLATLLVGQPVTAFVCVPAEETSFSLPTVERGRDCRGAPALRPSDLMGILSQFGEWGVAVATGAV